MVLTFETQREATSWAYAQPRGLGRLYMIVYPNRFKVGCSQNIRYRISEQIHGSKRVHVGPVSESYRSHERWYHNNCAAPKRRKFSCSETWRWISRIETYQRHAGIEAATLAWFAAGYSEALKPTIRHIVKDTGEDPSVNV